MRNYYNTATILLISILTLFSINIASATSLNALKNDAKCISGDCQNGKGKVVFGDNTIYEGEFKNGLADGYGICNYSDGSTYTGFWKENNIEGEGIYYENDGKTIKGIWKNNQLVQEKSNVLNEKVTAYQDILEDENSSSTKTSDSNSKTWVVIVGIARYPNKRSLNFTDDDAYRFHSFVKSPEGGAIKDEQIKLLIDETATKNNILIALKTMSLQADENDVFLFYFSGHGISGGFLPHDYLDESTIVEHDEVMKILNKSAAKSKIVIADACHSGSMIAHRGIKEEAAIENYYNAIQKNEGGLVLLMSSKEEETSLENKGLRQGVFSFYLLKGLKGAADENTDKIICAKELFEYVKTNVSTYTNYYQTPVIYGKHAVTVPIGVVRD
jgi:hypothetical protein